MVFDKPGSNRAPFRDAHIATVPDAVNGGIVTAGGPLFADELRSKMAGTFFHLKVSSREEAMEFLKKDVYHTNGIWDLDSVVIHPMVTVVSLPKTIDGINTDLFQK